MFRSGDFIRFIYNEVEDECNSHLLKYFTKNKVYRLHYYTDLQVIDDTGEPHELSQCFIANWFEKVSAMTLDDAIKHAKENSCGNDMCSSEHKQLAEWLESIPVLQAELKQWKNNHDNVVKKLRLFTQRSDLPVDRLPAYEYVLQLESQLETLREQLKKLQS